MKFLVDAQLPKRMCAWLAAGGCDAVHTLDLPAQNRTPDNNLIAAADQDGRAIITKDADFVDSHLLHGKPQKLLLVSTGNISNDDLCALLTPLIVDIVREFQTCRFIELSRTGVIARG